jgi:hypothetical protein
MNCANRATGIPTSPWVKRAGCKEFGYWSESVTVRVHPPHAALAGITRRKLENALGDRDRSSVGAMSTRVRGMLVEHLGQS